MGRIFDRVFAGAALLWWLIFTVGALCHGQLLIFLVCIFHLGLPVILFFCVAFGDDL
jgi:hypothetical protein